MWWSTIVYNIFIDVATTGVTSGQRVELYALNLLIRDVKVVLWSTIVYKVFIDTDVAPTGQDGSTICTDLTKKRGNSTFLVN